MIVESCFIQEFLFYDVKASFAKQVELVDEHLHPWMKFAICMAKKFLHTDNVVKGHVVKTSVVPTVKQLVFNAHDDHLKQFLEVLRV